jgi:hypothetical protein
MLKNYIRVHMNGTTLLKTISLLFIINKNLRILRKTSKTLNKFLQD